LFRRGGYSSRVEVDNNNNAGEVSKKKEGPVGPKDL